MDNYRVGVADGLNVGADAHIRPRVVVGIVPYGIELSILNYQLSTVNRLLYTCIHLRADFIEWRKVQYLSHFSAFSGK